MAVYAWRGVNATGKTVKGVRDAESPKALRMVLRRDGVLVTEVVEENEANKRGAREVNFKRYFQFVSAQDVALATRQLATLIRAGIPLVEALTALIDQIEHPDMQSAFTQTRDKVNEGTSFADALKAHPKIFSHLYVNMVAAGEASGMLEVVLARLADFLESQAQLKGKVVGALVYPAMMIVLTLGIVLFLMTSVVPQVTSIFNDFSQVLPWYTRLLIFTSDMILDFWWLWIALFVGAIYGFRRWRATTAGREKWDRFVLTAPLFGKLLTMVAVSRFSRTLATLLSSGVPILHAMEITRNILGNTALMKAIEDARDNVREGESIAKPLKASGRFPPLVTHMIAIGERSGQLEEMLEHVAHNYDQQVDVRVNAMTRILEPLVIVVMGGVVMFIALSILMPLLQINEFVQ
jgi:general secretion pathway protein F